MSGRFKNTRKMLFQKFNSIVNNVWFILLCNICSIVGIILTFIINNKICTIIICSVVIVFTCVVVFYIIYRILSVKRAKQNIQAKYVALDKEIFISIHKFFHDLRDCNNFLDWEANVSQENFKDKAKLLCNQIEKIFTTVLPVKKPVSVCIKLIKLDSVLDKDIKDGDVYTFARSSSTSDERINLDREQEYDRIIDNTDFEIIVSDEKTFRQDFNYFYCEDLDSYPEKFKVKYAKDFINSHKNFKYKSAIVVPIRIKSTNMAPILKELMGDINYYHVLGFLCIDSEEKFINEKTNFRYSIFKSSVKLACAIGDSLYHFFETYLIKELS